MWAKENLSLRSQLSHLESLTSEDIVGKTALQLMADIKKQEISKAWPPQGDPEIEESIIVQSVSLFLCHLLTGKGGHSQASQKVKRFIWSLVSDIVYAATRGKAKPPKHIMLPLIVAKSLTGNVELIHILNRLGYMVSCILRWKR